MIAPEVLTRYRDILATSLFRNGQPIYIFTHEKYPEVFKVGAIKTASFEKYRLAFIIKPKK